MNQDPNLIVKSYNASAINASIVDDDYSDDGKGSKKQKKDAKKSRKKVDKAFKGSENEKDFKESFGASESLGNMNAENQRDSQIQAANDI